MTLTHACSPRRRAAAKQGSLNRAVALAAFAFLLSAAVAQATPTSRSQIGDHSIGIVDPAHAEVFASGAFITPTVFGSSVVLDPTHAARSFINLSTGELGAVVTGEGYSDGFRSEPSTRTSTDDFWNCTSNCGLVIN